VTVPQLRITFFEAVDPHMSQSTATIWPCQCRPGLNTGPLNGWSGGQYYSTTKPMMWAILTRRRCSDDHGGVTCVIYQTLTLIRNRSDNLDTTICNTFTPNIASTRWSYYYSNRGIPSTKGTTPITTNKKGSRQQTQPGTDCQDNT
jgi:hypothetical protein